MTLTDLPVGDSIYKEDKRTDLSHSPLHSRMQHDQQRTDTVQRAASWSRADQLW